MNPKRIIMKILLLSLFVLAMGNMSVSVLAEKKATEGQNEADIEFYEPTPKKPEPEKPETKKPEPKILEPVTRLLPKTGENRSQLNLIGISLLGLCTVIFFTRKRVGEENEN